MSKDLSSSLALPLYYEIMHQSLYLFDPPILLSKVGLTICASKDL